MQVVLPCVCLPAGCRLCPAPCLLTAAPPRSCLLSAKPGGQVQLSPNPHEGDMRAEPAGLAAGALPPQNTFRSNRNLRDALGHFLHSPGSLAASLQPKETSDTGPWAQQDTSSVLSLEFSGDFRSCKVFTYLGAFRLAMRCPAVLAAV